MAFGNEMDDFLKAFQVGYSMFKSKDEKEWEKEKKEMERQRHAWGREDRDFRRERAERSDFESDRSHDWSIEEAARRDARYHNDDQYRREDLEIRRNDVKLRHAAGTGEGSAGEQPVYDPSGFTDPNNFTDPMDVQNAPKPADMGPGDQSMLGGSGSVQVASADPNEWAGLNATAYAPAHGAIPANAGAQQLENMARGNAAPATDRATQGVIQYANQGATRNKPLSDRLAGTLESFLPDLGVTAKVFSGGQDAKGKGRRRTGSVRHDHGDAADVFFYKDGRRLDWSNPKDRPIFEEIVRRGKANGLTGFGAGDGYMQRGSMHIGFGAPGVWGKGGKGANAPDWLRRAYGAARGGMITALPEEDERQNDLVPMPRSVEVYDMPASEEEVQVAQSEGAIPLPTPAPRYDGAVEGTSRGNSGGKLDAERVRRRAIYETAKTAALEGMKEAAKTSGFDINSAIADPELEQQRQNFLRGYGAAPEQMMRQVIDKIDPERQMRPAERNMAAMAEVYKFYLDRGDIEKAQASAQSMVMYYQRAFQQFAALSVAAGQAGDIDNATKAALAAYAQIPNGRDLTIEKLENGNLSVSVTDMDTGDIVNKQIMDPKNFAAIAMGFTPAMFLDELLNAAGKPKEEISSKSGEASEVAAEGVREVIDPYIDEIQAASNIPEKLQLKKEERLAVTDIAADMLRIGDNPIDADLAARYSARLFEFNPTMDEEGNRRASWATPFSYERKPNSNIWRMKIGDREFNVPKSTIDAVEKIRGRIQRDILKEEDLDQKGRDSRSEAGGLFGNAWDAFTDALRGSPDQGAIPEDRQSMPVFKGFSLPRDEPEDPSWVPEPDKPVFVR